MSTKLASLSEYRRNKLLQRDVELYDKGIRPTLQNQLEYLKQWKTVKEWVRATSFINGENDDSDEDQD